MPTLLSRKRLSTLQGQQAILASIALDKTMGDADGRFQGDPSLRVLLADEITKFPFTDELFAISTACELRNWEDSKVQADWLQTMAPKVKSPDVIAVYYSRNSHRRAASLPLMDRDVVKREVWLMERYALRSLISDAFTAGVMEPMYLAAEIANPNADDSHVANHFHLAVKLWGKGSRQELPGLAHMVNTRIRRTIGEYEADGLSSLFMNLSQFFERKLDGLHITLDLRPPLAYKMPVVLSKFKTKEEA